jgi:hypothetical protein
MQREREAKSNGNVGESLQKGIYMENIMRNYEEVGDIKCTGGMERKYKGIQGCER